MISEKDRAVLKKFGEHLKELKDAQKLTYREFSKRSGVNTGDIILYENGQSGPTLITIKKLAIGLGIHPSKLLDFEFGIDFSAGLE
jgi:transcriptional regulator with XRE-family HTH domain